MTETQECIALMRAIDLESRHHPLLAHLLHIPNGEYRDKKTAARLKQMGVKAGASDYLLPVPVGEFHGLWVEMKAGKGTPTEEQRKFLLNCRAQGYAAEWVIGWKPAIQLAVQYLRREYRMSLSVATPWGR